MTAPRRKPSFTSLVAFFLIVMPPVYALSYAPVVSFCGRSAPFGATFPTPLADGYLYPAYRPVDWLIDNTPLREPLFKWAEVWDVRDQFERGEWFRSFDDPEAIMWNSIGLLGIAAALAGRSN